MSSNSPITGRPNTQPITKEKDKHRKVLQKLQAYKKAYDKQSFQSQLPTEEIRVGLESSAPFSLYSSSNSHGMHTPFGSEYSPHPKPSSVSSHGTAFTQDTRHSTSVWSASNGMEAQEKQKKKLGPVLQARKDLVRTLGSCQLCSPRKIKCLFSHHSLEDVLETFPKARDLVEWALRHSGDPKQLHDNATSRNPSTNPKLETHIENPEDEVRQAMDVLEVDPLDLGDMGGYSTQIVLDEFGTGLDSNGPSMNLAHDLPSAVSPTDLGCTGFGQPTIPLPVESYSTPGLMGLGSMFVGAQPAADFSPAQYPPTQQNQQYQLQQQTMQLSDRTQHRQGANRSRTAGSLGSSVPSQHTIPSRPNFDRYPTTPARLSVPSQPALMSQGTFQSYSPSSGSQRSLSDASYVFSDSGYQFQSPNSSPSSDAKVLAIVDRQPYGTSYQCSLSPFSGNSSCNRILSSRNHMLEHLAKEHADYNVYRTLRKVCQICNAFYSLSTAGFCSNCTLPGMNVQLQLAICGESSDFTSMVNDDTDPMTSSVVFSPQASFGSPAPGACWNSGVPPDQSNSGPYW